MRTFVIFLILAILLVSIFAEEVVVDGTEAQPSETSQRVRRQLGFGGIGIGVNVIDGGYGGEFYPNYYPTYYTSYYPSYYPAYAYGGGFGYGRFGFGRRFHRRGFFF